MDLVLYERILGAFFALYWVGRLVQTLRRQPDPSSDETPVYPFGATRERYIRICWVGIAAGIGIILLAPLIFGR
jgi:hypothetical protein